MSKHKNYGGYFKSNQKEEVVNEPVQETVEEVQAVEETQEERHCEAPAEEQKEEDLELNRCIIAKVSGAKRVNMRLDASTEAPVLTVLSEGEEVRILEKSSDGTWARIQYNDKCGFMMSQFLKEI